MADEGQEHGGPARTQPALSLVGNVVIALGSVAPTASIALTLSAIVATTSYASPIAVPVCAVPMLGIAMAYRRLNMWHVNCGATYVWGGRAISPYFGWMTGWVIILAYFLGAPPRSHTRSARTRCRWCRNPVGGLDRRRRADRRDRRSWRSRRSHTSASGDDAPPQGLLILIEYVAITIVGILGLIGIFGGGSHSVAFDWSWFSWSTLGGVTGFVNASLIAVYMYSGWDTAILLNEETEDVRTNPGRA